MAKFEIRLAKKVTMEHLHFLQGMNLIFLLAFVSSAGMASRLFDALTHDQDVNRVRQVWATIDSAASMVIEGSWVACFLHYVGIYTVLSYYQYVSDGRTGLTSVFFILVSLPGIFVWLGPVRQSRDSLRRILKSSESDVYSHSDTLGRLRRWQRWFKFSIWLACLLVIAPIVQLGHFFLDFVATPD